MTGFNSNVLEGRNGSVFVAPPDSGPVKVIAATETALGRGKRFAGYGLFTNALLAIIKGLAGILGHSYALIADAVESVADIGGSLVVWTGLHLSARKADDDHPYGHGKAEPLAAALVGLMLCGAAFAIAVKGAQQVTSPRHAPEAFTLVVLVLVIVTKETLFRTVLKVAGDVGSGAVVADAWHHRSDAVTSAMAFVGISASLIGGPGWEWCDGAAALVASLIIGFNGYHILRPAVHELMDGAPNTAVLEGVARAATGVEGVRYIEKLKARKVGTRFLVDLHVQADPTISLQEAHILSGCVKTAIRTALPAVENVLVHMEPFEDPRNLPVVLNPPGPPAGG